MLVRELASKKELLRSGRIEHRGKRKSHGFGRERGLLEVPEKITLQRRLRYELSKIIEKKDMQKLDEILSKLTKKQREQMSDEIRRSVEILVARSSLMHSEELITFAKIVEASKKPKNIELRRAVGIWTLELRILRERNVSGKKYLQRYRKEHGITDDPEKADRENLKGIKESIVRNTNDKKITIEKIRIPREGSLVLEGMKKRVTITEIGIKEKEWEVLEVEIEEKN